MSRVKTTIQERLASGKTVSTFTSGTSMEPLLYDHETWVDVAPVKGALKKGDLPLFLREDGNYVIHRIVRVLPGGYRTRGDNCVSSETIAREQVLGVVTDIHRRGRHIRTTDLRYRLYGFWQTYLFPARRILGGLCTFARKLRRRLRRFLREDNGEKR